MSVTTIYRQDWKGQARREAAALLDEVRIQHNEGQDAMVELLACAWLKGADAGTAAIQELIEDAAEKIKRHRGPGDDAA